MAQQRARSGFRNPHALPVKQCVTCGRPFTWRKKWAANWEEVKYCSEGCRKKTGAN
ncbi:MAG: DUF2256 domain-containing protein [Betaproteobacteria bacterium]|nr:DUF2256 domain-containing protein [Betaproteobacteria bacterium]